MRAALVCMALVASLMAQAPAKSLNYDLLEDWEKLGYVLKVEDTGPMSMAFTTTAGAKDVYLNGLRLLPRMGFFIQSKNDTEGAWGLTTDWKTVPVSGFSSFVSGVTGVRVRFVIMAYSQGTGSLVQARTDLEVSEDDAWKSQSSTEMRNQIRGAMASILGRPIYGDYDQLQAYFAEYTQADEPVLSREGFWQKYHLSGFRSLSAEVPSNGATTTSIAVAPLPTFKLSGAVKMREIARLGTPALVVTLAQDESGQKAVQLELGGKALTLPSTDLMVLLEAVKAGQLRRAQLAPGDSELGKELEAGSEKIQVGAKATASKPPARLLVLAPSSGSKVELSESDAVQLVTALERGRSFFLGNEDLAK